MYEFKGISKSANSTSHRSFAIRLNKVRKIASVHNMPALTNVSDLMTNTVNEFKSFIATMPYERLPEVTIESFTKYQRNKINRERSHALMMLCVTSTCIYSNQFWAEKLKHLSNGYAHTFTKDYQTFVVNRIAFNAA